MTDLDVLTLGMMMAEISPPRLGPRVVEAEALGLLPSGSATIFAMALARLGGRVGMISRVGDDEIGRWMIDQLASAGIDIGQVAVVPGQLSPLALASVDARGEKTFSYYRFAGFSDPLTMLRADEIADEALRRVRLFDFTEGSLRAPALRAETFRVVERARRLGLATCYTPNYRISGWQGGAAEALPAQRQAIALADLVIMNATEATLIANLSDVQAAARQLQASGPRVVVVTRGGDPIVVASDGTIVEIPAVRAEVVFDIGAGDTFHAGFLAAWRPGTDPVACATFAAHAAALKIGRPPQPEHLPTRDEVLQAIDAAGKEG